MTTAECSALTCVDGKCCGSTSCPDGSTCGFTGHAGTCVKKSGTACTGDGECGSGHCVDGVCCDKACSGQCEACDVTGHLGTCTPVSNEAPHGSVRKACDDLPANDCKRARCNGDPLATDRCAGFANAGTVSCGASSCTTDGKIQATGQCDGAGGCALPAPASCATFGCDSASGACFASCSSDAQCAVGFRCDTAAHVCVQGAHCNGDRSATIDKAGVETSCGVYRCGSDGTCGSKCTQSEDCVAPATCDVSAQQCLAPVPAIDGDGCSHTGMRGASGHEWRWLWSALAAITAMTVRRKRAGRRS